MKRPLAILIDDEPEDRELEARAIQSLPQGFLVEKFPSYEAYERWSKENPKIKPNVFLVDYVIKGSQVDGLKAAELLHNERPSVPIILVTGFERDFKKAIASSDFPNADDIVYKGASDLKKVIVTALEKQLRKRSIVMPYTPAVNGIGHLGNGAVETFQDLEFVENVYIHSKHGNRDRESFEMKMRNAKIQYAEKLKFCTSLENMIGENPDIIFDTCGQYGFGPKAIEFGFGENSILPLFENNLTAAKATYEALESPSSFRNLFVEEKNPPELLALWSRKHYQGLVTSFAADSIRARAHFFDLWGQKLNKAIGEVKENDIDIQMLGVHRISIPLNYTVKGIPIQDILPDFGDKKRAEEYRRELQGLVSNQAEKSAIDGSSINQYHKDTIAAIKEGIEDLAYLRTRPRSSWMCKVSMYDELAREEVEGYILAPVSIDYKKEIIKPSININELEEPIRSEILTKHLRMQNEAVKKAENFIGYALK